MLYTHDVTCNLSRRNNGANDIYKRSVKAKTFFKSSFFKYVFDNFSISCTSIQNIPSSRHYTIHLIEFNFLNSTSCVM